MFASKHELEKDLETRKKNIFKDCESLKFDKKYFLKEIGKKIFNEKSNGSIHGNNFFPKKQILK